MSKLIADIGGTNVRFGLINGAGKSVEDIRVFSCADYPTLAEAANTYLADAMYKPEAGAFAVATSLDGTDRVTMTNHVWDFSITGTRDAIGLKALRIVNDFAALTYSIPYLSDSEKQQVGSGTAVAGQPVAIIGPGTGLGVAAVIFDADGRAVSIPTEGGHVTMSASTPREYAIFEWLRQTKYHHISAERVCSGKGLINLYHAICALDGLELPEREAHEITAAALDKSCPVCVESLDLFCHFLGVAAGNLALSYGALGGIYIAGGIVPKLGAYFAESRFRESFSAKGRFSDYVGAIPTFVVTHPYPGLEGLRRIA